ncbi:hypothetical protein KY289_008099 [Solanum tuberosum]|nr:hypothetical protein KY289_008099 [Solanum tuberosum]
MFGSLDTVQIYISKKHEEESLEQQVDIDGNKGWILVTRRRRNKSCLRKESSDQPIRSKMVRKLEKQKSIKHPQRVKVEVHHYQKPRRPVTLEEFLPSSFYTKSIEDNVGASCFNTDKKETTRMSRTDKKKEKRVNPHQKCLLVTKPWVHENKIVSSSYYQCLKHLEGGIERKIVADDNHFTEVETHFADEKFYLKSYVVKGTKSNDVKSIKSNKITIKRINVAIIKVKVDTKELCPILNEGKIMSSNKKLTSGLRYVSKVKKEEGKSPYLQENVLRGLTLPITRIDAVNLSSKLPGKSISQNQVRDEALPTKRTREDITRKAGEGLGYNQPPPIHISIRRASNNHINFEYEVTTPNKNPSVFDRLGESTARNSLFERLGPLKKNNKNLRSYSENKVTSGTCDSYKEEPKANAHTVVYTKECQEDEESVGSSYHVTIQNDQDYMPQMKFDEELEDIVWCCHISINDNDPLEEEDIGDAPPELEEGVKTTIDP